MFVTWKVLRVGRALKNWQTFGFCPNRLTPPSPRKLRQNPIFSELFLGFLAFLCLWQILIKSDLRHFLGQNTNFCRVFKAPQNTYAKDFTILYRGFLKNLCSEKRSENNLTFAKYSRIRGNCVLKSDRKGKSFAK